MIKEIDAPHETSKTSKTHIRMGRNSSGFVKLLGGSGLVMALLLPLGIYPRVLQSKELDHANTAQAEVSRVSLVKPTSADSTRKLSLPGSIEAILETGIYARTNGYVHQRYVDIGDHVKAGQLLAEIETPEVDETTKEAKALVLTSQAAKAQARASLDKMQADLRTAEADLAQAKATLAQMRSSEKFALTSTQRWNMLVTQGAVSHQDADEKDTNYNTAKAATTAAEERVRSAQSQVVAAKAQIDAQKANIAASQANVEAAESRERNSNTQKRFQEVRAPFDGVIVERNVDQGALITSGSDNSRTSLYRLARIDTLKVYVDAPQFAAIGIHAGQQVNVTLKEFPGRTFKGTVARTSVALNSQARTLRVEVHIPNNEQLLAPGMYSDVAFSVERPKNAYVIPITALVSRGDGQQIATVQNGHVHFEPVQTGDDLGKFIEVVDGLKGGERVINNPSDALQEGDKVLVAEK
ncbi:MAG TPA: efflux RND transporter periplasmic adaptor subunit [Oculatellaceae cyanobacterium]